MKSLTGDIIGSIFFIVVGLWFLINSLSLSASQNTADFGPAAFPLISSIGLILASIFYIAREVIKKKAESNERISINNKNRVLISIVTLILYIFFIEQVSYFISSIIFIPLLLFVSGVKSLMQIVGVSVGFILFVYVGFDILLGIPLP